MEHSESISQLENAVYGSQDALGVFIIYGLIHLFPMVSR